MKPYRVLECDNINAISTGIYKFLKDSTTLLDHNVIGWQFLDHKQLFKAVPELLEFFSKYKLIPNSASVVILYETGQLPLHIDELPVVAKVNLPVINTKGWTNRWYSVSEENLANCPKTKNQFGSEVERLDMLPKSAFTFVDEVQDLDMPIVFNSRIPHEVVRIDGGAPRIIASFTFFNEPRNLLQ